ncbi:Vegetative incompatibility protein [Paramyrothecium foliicola]|nr:Vegetative incompatibility protein [Paramyrothecium foliicola]
MLLINAHTLLLEEFYGDAAPEYIILSHTWEADEVTLEDWKQPAIARAKRGYTKIIKTCEIARTRFGVDYVWVDTNCIDKRSSAELSEAINSMFQWYRNAKVCLAYLADVDLGEGADRQPDDWNKAISEPGWSAGGRFQRSSEQFRASRWFTRGWTLQELLAPRHVLFLSEGWQYIATKAHLQREISDITGIPKMALGGFPIGRWSVAEIMSWASRRSTSRVEDRAYSLMGLFDINMPLLYGEGFKAFRRLQEEIIKVSNDQSIFAWDLLLPPSVKQSTIIHMADLAPSPEHFKWVAPHRPNMVKDWVTTHGSRMARSRRRVPFVDRGHYMMTNSGLWITVPLVLTHDKTTFLMPIEFVLRDNRKRPRKYYLVMHSLDGVNFSRAPGFPLPIGLKLRMNPTLSYQTVYFTRSSPLRGFNGTIDPPLYQHVVVAVLWDYSGWDDVGFATLEPSDDGWQPQERDAEPSATLNLHATGRPEHYCRVFSLRDPRTEDPVYVLVASHPSNNRSKQLWKAYKLPDCPESSDTYLNLFDKLRQDKDAAPDLSPQGPYVFLQYPHWGEGSRLMRPHHPVVCVMHSAFVDGPEAIESDLD